MYKTVTNIRKDENLKRSTQIAISLYNSQAETRGRQIKLTYTDEAT